MKDGLRIPLMLTPALGLVVLLFGGGLLVGFGQSLGYFPAIGLHDFTLRYYFSVFTDKNFLQSLWLTFRIAAVTTVLSSVLAVGFTLVLRQKFAGSRVATFLFQVPLPVPHLVAASGIVLLVTQSGLIARFLAALGLINVPADFPALVFDRAGISIVLTFLWKEVPFIGLVVLAILQSVGPQYEELARTLGANARQRFFSVLLPLIMPGILSTSIIIFAFTFGNYEIPLLLGVRFPATLPVVAYRQYQDPDLALRPEAMAISIILAVVAVLLLVAYRRLARYAVR
ncbi:MAG: ABC transporter permease subunit [Actinobacteria bacterium]|nr:ABC transporter permease subunit [Actinomycetota bacterium]